MPVGDLTPPERHFSLFLKDLTSNINWHDVDEVIDAFERRIRSWYLEPAQILIDEMPGKEFIITNIGCTLVDTLSQFRTGKDAHDAQAYKEFTEDHFPDFEQELPKHIPSDLVVGSNYDVDTVSEAFYSGFRCGLTHSGTILAFGGHSVDTEGKLFQIWFDPDDSMAHCYDSEREEAYPFVVLNPTRLIDEIEDALKDYLSRLRTASNDDPLKQHFAQKITYDFGDYGRRLKESLDQTG
jgi:hypothetical protein